MTHEEEEEGETERGAYRAAWIILGGAASINTGYGVKFVDGLADIINRETAAPELLDALKNLADGVEHRGDDWANLDEARAAIAKAEGK
jgi:hypothetical protein